MRISINNIGFNANFEKNETVKVNKKNSRKNFF